MTVIDFNKIPQPILITGATGFIGSHIIQRLLKEEIKMIAFVLPKDTTPKEWENKIEIIYGDITNQSAVDEAMKKAKTVIHLAAIVGDWGAADLFKRVTIDGTRYILHAAAKNNVLTILTSSITIYGTALQNQICKEERGHGLSQGLYSWAKQQQEIIAQNLIKSEDLKCIIIRPANVYGPTSQPWVIQLIAAMKKGPSILGSGNQNAGLIYIDNLVALILLAASNKNAIGQIYNAAEDSTITWRQYMMDLSAIANINPPKAIPIVLAKPLASIMEVVWKLFRIKTRPQLTKEALNLVSADLRIPIEKAKQELNYEPIVSYEEGIEIIRVYYVKHFT